MNRKPALAQEREWQLSGDSENTQKRPIEKELFVDWSNMLIGLLQNKQNVSVNPLNLGRIIEMVSQVVSKFIQG